MVYLYDVNAVKNEVTAAVLGGRKPDLSDYDEETCNVAGYDTNGKPLKVVHSPGEPNKAADEAYAGPVGNRTTEELAGEPNAAATVERPRKKVIAKKATTKKAVTR